MKLRGLRWYMAGMLMLVTTINYIDRTSLGLTGDTLRSQLDIDENEFANIIIWFQASYLVMQPIAGRLIDWIGLRHGFPLMVIWWSVANMLHGLARGPLSFGIFRALLGMGEAGNFPGVAKTAGEWFPPRERTMATGIANVGSGTGAMLAVPLVSVILVWTGKHQGRENWQLAFVATGALGFLWVALWYLFYAPPERHPLMTDAERAHIEAGRRELNAENLDEPDARGSKANVYKAVLKQRNFWAIALTRFLSEPAWQFFSYWLVLYFKDTRGFNLKEIAYFLWVPFLAADVGSFVGGLLSPMYQRRWGVSVLTARKLAMLTGAAIMPVILMTMTAHSPATAVFWLCFGPFAHNMISAVMLTLPADVFPKRMVATANGLSGTVGYIGGMVFMKIVGLVIVKTHNYGQLFVIMAFLDLLGAMVLFSLLRTPPQAAAAVEPRSSANPPA